MNAYAIRTMMSEGMTSERRASGLREWLRRAEETLDGYGFWAWIGVMVVGLLVFAPIGLAVLGYMIWSGRMGYRRCGERSGFRRGRVSGGASGNSAFDAYREETMRRLEEEREAFDSFMGRLRKAKDQAEFEQFMNERRSGGQQSGG